LLMEPYRLLCPLFDSLLSDPNGIRSGSLTVC
jgi:hypothetical protein